MKKLISSICCVLCLITLGICSISIPNVKADDPKKDQDVFSSKSVFLLDFDSGDVLFEKESDARLPVASMVKIMTILLTFEEIDKGSLRLDELVTTSENASGMGGSQAFIDPYVEYSVEDLLKSVIIASANDASVALAERIGGSEEGFVKLMNKRANELSMTNTNYVNSTGLPAPEQYSCARDISILNRELLKHKKYFDYSKIWMEDLVHPSGRKTGLTNTNKLIRYFNGCDSGKTGSTDEAGYCLSASASRGGMRLISTVVGADSSQTRFNEASKLFNYGFGNFENMQIVFANEKLASIVVSMSSKDEIDVSAKSDFFGLSKKLQKSNYETRLVIPEKVKAPIKQGDTVGKIIVTKDGVVISEIEVVANEDASRRTFKESLKDVLNEWSL